ncbi:group II intron maturase-specific domain-containing protein [Paenibacillus sp. FSL K6-2859]|uniref:group II intron maturase-specific domain-containing protein n=1 Tax=Paenibacillus sp. FSL K6-2859 TaxID=2921482 RepID=UPI0030F9C1B6
MLEQLLSRENLLQALKRAEANKGSHGVDGMSVKSLREHIVQNWQTLRQSIVFIETRLKLKVKQAKSAVDRPWKRKFLGFSFSSDKEPKVRIAKQSLQKAKARIREITSRKKAMRMEERIQELNRYLMGWQGYFCLADTPSVLKAMDMWIRRRLRMCLWKQWKNPRTKVKRLISLGVPKDIAYEWGNTRKGYWRIAGSPILQRALNNQYCERTGARRPLLLDF